MPLETPNHSPVSPFLVFPTQVIHVDNQPVLVVTDQLPNFALINSLVFLQNSHRMPQQPQIQKSDVFKQRQLSQQEKYIHLCGTSEPQFLPRFHSLASDSKYALRGQCMNYNDFLKVHIIPIITNSSSVCSHFSTFNGELKRAPKSTRTTNKNFVNV